MVVIPAPARVLLTIVECLACQKIYFWQPPQVNCAVNHAPGTCCHYDEMEVSEIQLSAVMKALGR